MSGALISLPTCLHAIHRKNFVIPLYSVWRKKKLKYTQLKRYMLFCTDTKLCLLLWRKEKMESEREQNDEQGRGGGKRSILRKMQHSLHDWRMWVAIRRTGRDFSTQWAVLGFDTTQCCRKIPTCWMCLLPPLHSWRSCGLADDKVVRFRCESVIYVVYMINQNNGKEAADQALSSKWEV